MVVTVMAAVPATGWRYVRDVRDADGLTVTYPVDAFLVWSDGNLSPVAYDPMRGTVHLEDEATAVILQTTAARVEWARHFGEEAV